MNTYQAFWKGKAIVVEAETSYEAQGKAAAEYRLSTKKRHEVTIVLTAKDGKMVTHSTNELPGS